MMCHPNSLPGSCCARAVTQTRLILPVVLISFRCSMRGLTILWVQVNGGRPGHVLRMLPSASARWGVPLRFP